MRGDDKLVIPCPVFRRDGPVEFSNLDGSRTRWKSGKVICDVLSKNGRYDMRDVRCEYVPAQRAECEATRQMSEQGSRRDL